MGKGTRTKPTRQSAKIGRTPSSPGGLTLRSCGSRPHSCTGCGPGGAVSLSGPQFPIWEVWDCTKSVAVHRGRFCPPEEHQAASGGSFGCHPRSLWVKPKEAAQHPTRWWTGPCNKGLLVQKVSTAELEKPALGGL